MGLIMDGTTYSILSDIQGMEDHEGDMEGTLGKLQEY